MSVRTKSPGLATARMKGAPPGRWRLEADDIGSLRRALGDDLLVAFIRCFVHADRLSTLADFGRRNGNPDVPQVAQRRNIATIIWFATGTLRELAYALRRLRSLLARRQWLLPDDPHQARLWEVEKRWESDRLLRGLRNQAAYHVDEDVIAKGLTRLGARPGVVVLIDGEGSHGGLPLGNDVLTEGLELTQRDFDHWMRAAYEDASVYLALDRVFATTLIRAGVVIVEEQNC